MAAPTHSNKGNIQFANVLQGHAHQEFGGGQNIGKGGLQFQFITHIHNHSSESDHLSSSANTSGDDLSSAGTPDEGDLLVQHEVDSQQTPPRIRASHWGEQGLGREEVEDVPLLQALSGSLQGDLDANGNREEPPFPPRKALAVTNWSNENVRAYFQDTDGHVRELSQTHRNKGNWHINPDHIGIEDAKSGTPLAVISRFNGSEIHVFYISTRNTVHERCFFEGTGWTEGTLSEGAVLTYPGSQLVAVASASVIRAYYQAPSGAIHECSLSDTDPLWKVDTTPATALKGSAIAAVAYPGSESLVVHLYCQAEDEVVREYIWKKSAWEEGNFPQTNAQRYTTLAAVSLECPSTQICVYWRSTSGTMVERRTRGEQWDRRTKDLSLSDSLAAESQLAVIEEAGMFSVLRAYFIAGQHEIGEVAYNMMKRKWDLGVKKRHS